MNFGCIVCKDNSQKGAQRRAGSIIWVLSCRWRLRPTSTPVVAGYSVRHLQQPDSLKLDGLITFATRRPQPFQVGDFDVALAVADDAGRLHCISDDPNPVAAAGRRLRPGPPRTSSPRSSRGCNASNSARAELSADD